MDQYPIAGSTGASINTFFCLLLQSSLKVNHHLRVSHGGQNEQTLRFLLLWLWTWALANVQSSILSNRIRHLCSEVLHGLILSPIQRNTNWRAQFKKLPGVDRSELCLNFHSQLLSKAWHQRPSVSVLCCVLHPCAKSCFSPQSTLVNSVPKALPSSSSKPSAIRSVGTAFGDYSIVEVCWWSRRVDLDGCLLNAWDATHAMVVSWQQAGEPCIIVLPPGAGSGVHVQPCRVICTRRPARMTASYYCRLTGHHSKLPLCAWNSCLCSSFFFFFPLLETHTSFVTRTRIHTRSISPPQTHHCHITQRQRELWFLTGLWDVMTTFDVLC